VVHVRVYRRRDWATAGSRDVSDRDNRLRQVEGQSTVRLSWPTSLPASRQLRGTLTSLL